MEEKYNHKVFCRNYNGRKLMVIDLAWIIFHRKIEKLNSLSFVETMHNSKESFEERRNLFYFNKLDISFDTRITLENEDIDEIINLVHTYGLAEPRNTIIGISMQYIYKNEKNVFKFFLEKADRNLQFFFYNIDRESDIYDNMKDSFEEVDGISMIYCPEYQAITNIIDLSLPEYIDACNENSKKEITSILQSVITKHDNLQLLLSSSVYSSHYVNIKQLFHTPCELTLVVYYLAKMTIEKKLKYDALIATSKNGAILASLLGEICNKDVVYCINIGPKFSISANLLDRRIELGKRYLHVSDFICLGTEIKTIYAILAGRHAELVGGVGIASYIHVGNLNPDLLPPLSNVECLINLVDEGIDYSIQFSRQPTASEVKQEEHNG